MTCEQWCGGDVCWERAVWRVICHSGGGERLACASHVARMVEGHRSCQVEAVACG